jgi:hypothetical protein
MKRALTKTKSEQAHYYYYARGSRCDGAPAGITGDLSGIRGDLTGIRGDADDCEISASERDAGIDAKDLMKGA